MAVVLISLNEEHHMGEVLDNLAGWASEVYLVDSCSADRTVDIALARGVHVVQRRFRGFGDQWNFALDTLPIRAPWTMKVDPDERLSDELKASIVERTCDASETADLFNVRRQLCFMSKPLPVVQTIPRLWRTGRARFSDVLVNEHVICDGPEATLAGTLLHLDSPSLEHWIAKQNRYSTSEAVANVERHDLSRVPRLLGSPLERRMWIKAHFTRFPFRYTLLYLYHMFVVGAWRAGRVGRIWSHLRNEVYRMAEFKEFEIRTTGSMPPAITTQVGAPDPRVPQYD